MKETQEQFTLDLDGYASLDVVARFEWFIEPDGTGADFDLLHLWVDGDDTRQYLYEFLRSDLQTQLDGKIFEWITHRNHGTQSLVEKD